ncbi:MAG: class I SAM-dependent methyltransferase [Anaerolineae bacterium]
MRKETISYLRNLNRAFYGDFAAYFADSRGRTEPGLERALLRVTPGARVLDLGCGHGRVAALLPPACSYTGLDFSAEILALADPDVAHGVKTRFAVVDLMEPGWVGHVRGTFEWIIARAIFHHIPGYTTRLRVLRQAASCLTREGRLVLANWQFLAAERLQRRIQNWSEVGLSEDDVEPGDYLLDWRRGGRGFRYVHLLDEDETRRLAGDAGLGIEEMYRADGRENNLTLYAILKQKTSSASA